MTDPAQNRLSRRRLLQAGGATHGAGALTMLGGRLLLNPASKADAATFYIDPSTGQAASDVKTIALAGTDGWITLPEQTGATLTNILIPSSQSVMPDALAQDYVSLPSGNTPVPQNAYIYCFRDVTDAQRRLNTDPTNQAALDDIYSLKGKTQQCAPIIALDAGKKYHLVLYNLGWAVRPDIPDGHTVHFHGFKNAIPWFDGVPEMSGGAPQGKTFHYFYQPVDSGTYMYHCHWEDVEHVQMGMTGVIYVRPKRWTTATKYAYEQGDNGYDREFAFMLMDYDIEQHWKLAHIQQPDWSDYKATHWTMNGRSYPDTLLPNHEIDDPDPLTTFSAVNLSGTVTFTHLGTTVTGSFGAGVSFITQGVKVGDLVYRRSGTGNGPVTATKIAAVAANTLTLETGYPGSSGSNGGAAFIHARGALTEYARYEALTSGNARYLNGMSAADAADKMAYQPISSRITCNQGDRVLLRISNLGYEEHNMALEGLIVTVHGRDASLLRNNDGTLTAYQTDTMQLGPGESYDAIFVAPTYTGVNGAGNPDVYMFYDRNYAQDAGTAKEFGGMATEIHVFPPGTMKAQVNPNEWGV
jgi:FtsP/CotA-like multicopper oxidase with cupredoxin domain